MKHCIPMKQVLARKSVIHNIPRKMYFPLYKNYNEVYNYANLKDSICKWNSYTDSISESVDKMLELYSIIVNKGTQSQIDEATSLISNNILSISEYEHYIPEVRHTINSNKIMNTIKEAQIIDKLIENHNFIMKRFNVNQVVIENANDESMTECICKLCEFIDTYNMGIDSKYKACLEEISYLFAKNNIKYDNIIEDVTDYFLMTALNENDEKHELLDIMESVIDKNSFIESKEYITYLKSLLENKKEIAIDEGIIDNAREKTKAAIAKFKLMINKSDVSFRNLIFNNLLVLHKDQDIIDDSVNILSLAFYGIIVIGSIAVSLWAGIASAIVAKIINYKAERSYYKKTITVWKNNRERARKRLEKETNPDKINTIKEYIKVLDDSIIKLESYAEEELNIEPEQKDDDFNFTFNELSNLIESFNKIEWNFKEANEALCESKIYKNMELQDIDYITEFAIKYPNMINNNNLISSMKEAANELRQKPTLKNYYYISILNQNISLLNNSLKEELSEDDLKMDSNSDINMLNELYNYTESLNPYIKAIHELSLANTFKLAIDKISKKFNDLSNAEKIASRNVDALGRRISKAIENDVNTENREAVIRGEILPSLSRIIKIILFSGLTLLISPYLTAVYLITRLMMSKKARKKERQLVLNELDVELVIIDKYIHKAEESGNMKRLRKLLLLKKKLQAQYVRLKYRVSVDYSEHDANDYVKSSDDEN